MQRPGNRGRVRPRRKGGTTTDTGNSRRREFETLTGSTRTLPDLGENASPRLPRGAIVNQRYRVEECLGEGGMGVVYKVFDPLNPDRSVALKFILLSSTQPQRIDRFKAEFRTLTELRHPNIASAYDFEPLQGSEDCFFTMEFVDGTDVLRGTEGAGWQRIADLLVQVCRALSYVHSRKIIHYDIKPGNVFVDDAGGIKVLDFGLAAAKPIGPMMMGFGTPRFMAPEMADPETFVDHRADLYSLGIMTFELLCRRTPFPTKSWSELMAMHRARLPEFEETEKQAIPDWFRSVTLRLCANHAADRYPTANAVIEDVNRSGGRAALRSGAIQRGRRGISAERRDRLRAGRLFRTRTGPR